MVRKVRTALKQNLASGNAVTASYTIAQQLREFSNVSYERLRSEQERVGDRGTTRGASSRNDGVADAK